MKLTLTTDAGEVLDTWDVELSTDKNKYAYDVTNPIAAQALISEIKEEMDHRALEELTNTPHVTEVNYVEYLDYRSGNYYVRTVPTVIIEKGNQAIREYLGKNNDRVVTSIKVI